MFFKENYVEINPDPASDDFSRLAGSHKIPYAYWTFGGTSMEEYDDAEKKGKLGELPSNHSALFWPAIEPTLCTGVDAMALAALSYLI